MKPEYGAIATCGAGKLGVITTREPNARGYWLGIHLGRQFGNRWMSKKPKVLGVLSQDAADELRLIAKESR